ARSSLPKHWEVMIHRSAGADDDESPQAALERLTWFRTAAREDCDTVVVAGLLKSAAARHVVTLAERHDMRVVFSPPQLHRTTYDLRVEREGRQVLLAPTPLAIMTPAADFCKTLFDGACALIALILLSPVLCLTALAIRLEGPGPIFFRQERIGRYGCCFRMCKFRSMQDCAGGDWATLNDRRVTRVGAFIRRFSIDELPQLFNVLCGEMSLVGPRPEMREYAERFKARLPRYDDRHLARPGITGWTQINMRRHLTPDDIERVLENDLFYVENWSFVLDLSILFKTAMEFLFHRGV
ncbi:MAG: sugar transferase, partial [Vulcanimicrobiaceae bacterium]